MTTRGMSEQTADRRASEMAPMTSADVERLEEHRREHESSPAVAAAGVMAAAGVLVGLAFVALSLMAPSTLILTIPFGVGLAVLSCLPHRELAKHAQAIEEDLRQKTKEVLRGQVTKKVDPTDNSCPRYVLRLGEREAEVDLSTFVRTDVGDLAEVHLAPRAGLTLRVVTAETHPGLPFRAPPQQRLSALPPAAP